MRHSLAPQPPQSARVQARLFGSLALQQENEPLPLPSLAGARSLLAYLLLHRHRPHPRAVLVGLFWPDVPENRARRALSQALWHLRRSLPGADLLQADAHQVGIPPQAPIWVDVAAFEALVAPHLGITPPSETAVADLSRAVGLYRGELLEGMYADWVHAEGRRLRELYQQALGRLLRLEKQADHDVPTRGHHA